HLWVLLAARTRLGILESAHESGEEPELAGTCRHRSPHNAAQLPSATRCKTHHALHSRLRHALGQARLDRLDLYADYGRRNCDQWGYLLRGSCAAHSPVRCPQAELHEPPDDDSAYPSSTAHFVCYGHFFPDCDGHLLLGDVEDNPRPATARECFVASRSVLIT